MFFAQVKFLFSRQNRAEVGNMHQIGQRSWFFVRPSGEAQLNQKVSILQKRDELVCHGEVLESVHTLKKYFWKEFNQKFNFCITFCIGSPNLKLTAFIRPENNVLPMNESMVPLKSLSISMFACINSFRYFMPFLSLSMNTFTNIISLSMALLVKFIVKLTWADCFGGLRKSTWKLTKSLLDPNSTRLSIRMHVCKC